MLWLVPSLAFLFAAVLTNASALANQTSSAKSEQADVIVYGGTASGVITAYSAAREGLHVILLEPRNHLGGIVTGGLSATDLGEFRIIGGYAREFYMRAAEHYGLDDPDQRAN
jgi:glycine/D-amino acid oxidase-like deaminating enzyme